MGDGFDGLDGFVGFAVFAGLTGLTGLTGPELEGFAGVAAVRLTQPVFSDTRATAAAAAILLRTMALDLRWLQPRDQQMNDKQR